ncbi:hypothetical protein [Porphyrobacter sp. AAP82]|uniref:hypothetical protein n=1 Tax=Porphyrobacter sp. AAP82 TaxID=1248917 RepID=UPI00030927C2|nr:hypothetical protein [Porphyrobacter sp. AAP82]
MIRISRRARMLTGCLAAALATAASLAWPAQAAIARGAMEAEAPDEGAAASPNKGEQRLARLLEGRVAGEPVRCIPAFRNLSMQTIDRTAYVYGRGDTIYVQRTRNPKQIDNSDYLRVIRRDSTQLCREDQTVQVEPFSGMLSGAVFFEDFVPYTRVKPAAGEG